MDWLRLQKALSIEADKGFNDLEGKQHRFSEFLALTLREQEVLGLIAAGLSSKAIARRLDLSVRTIETHRLNIRKKTGARDRRDLVRIAGRFGLAVRFGR